MLIEGMVIAGIAIGATKGYVYIRSEYPDAIARMEEAIAIARKRSDSRRVGARHRAMPSTWRCASARAPMSAARRRRCSNSLEGKRGVVRAKPPLPAHQGLFGKPTVVNNVISLATVPVILEKGAEHYRDFGLGRSRGTMPIQIAGNVRHGGLFETAFGMTLGEIVDEHRRRHGYRPPGAGGAGRRPARRLFPACAVRHALRLRGLRGQGRADRPCRHRRLRRQRRHAEAGALRHGVLRHRKLRQVHALPHRLDARRRDHRQDRARRRSRPRTSLCSPIFARR